MSADLNPPQHSAIPTAVLLGTPLALVDYESLLGVLPELALESRCTAIAFCNTQTVTLACLDPSFRAASEACDYSIPDGMPLVWCLRGMGLSLPDRTYGPTFMRYALTHEKQLTHYFLGGSEETLQKLAKQAKNLSAGRFQIVGSSSRGYDSDAHQAEIVDEINRLSPDVIWIGLGTPKQQHWIRDHKHRIYRGVLLSVGFAFDVNAGIKRDAPEWMQKRGLTWIFRVSQEPGRLLGRYLRYNTLFVLLILLALLRHGFASLRRAFVRSRS